ncbi:MAG: hypothetical protein RIG62_24650 [Cyclobacteriaceae bacterium]
MEKYAFLLSVGVLFVGCNHQEMETRIAELETERQEIMASTEQKDATITEFMESLSSVENNLREIRAREMSIELTQEEKDLSTKETEKRIVADIQAIDALLAENRKTIQRLNQQLAGAYGKNAKLNKSMTKLKEELTQQIQQRETEIGTLKEQLVAMEMKIDTLNVNVADLEKTNTAKDSVIQERVIELNEAYFITGTSKELQEKSVIDKRGGVLGLGRTTTLADNYNARQFTRIDIRENVTFPLPSDDVKLATAHPTDSYKIQHDASSESAKLVISNPEKFWESSKYLVMVVK